MPRPATHARELRPFDQSLPHVLLRAREATMRFFRPLLSAHDLTEQQWRVLRALRNNEEAPDVGALAELTCLLGPSLSRILTNLEARDLIARAADPEDQRRAWISLTAAGEELVARIAPSSEAQYAKIEEQVGAETLEELFALLERLAALDDPNSPTPERTR